MNENRKCKLRAAAAESKKKKQNHLAIWSEDKAPYLQSRVMPLTAQTKNSFLKRIDMHAP
jgi:hypothetical protein